MCRPWLLRDREDLWACVEVCTPMCWREKRPRRLLGCGLLTALLVPWPQLRERLDRQTCAHTHTHTRVRSDYWRSWSCVSAECSDLVQHRPLAASSKQWEGFCKDAKVRHLSAHNSARQTTFSLWKVTPKKPAAADDGEGEEEDDVPNKKGPGSLAADVILASRTSYPVALMDRNLIGFTCYGNVVLRKESADKPYPSWLFGWLLGMVCYTYPGAVFSDLLFVPNAPLRALTNNNILLWFSIWYLLIQNSMWVYKALQQKHVFIWLTTWWLADATRASLLFLERAVAHQPVFARGVWQAFVWCGAGPVARLVEKSIRGEPVPALDKVQPNSLNVFKFPLIAMFWNMIFYMVCLAYFTDCKFFDAEPKLDMVQCAAKYEDFYGFCTYMPCFLHLCRAYYASCLEPTSVIFGDGFCMGSSSLIQKMSSRQNGLLLSCGKRALLRTALANDLAHKQEHLLGWQWRSARAGNLLNALLSHKWDGLLAHVLAEEDGSCLLQAQHEAHGMDRRAMAEAKQMKAQLRHALHDKSWNKGFCKGEPITEYNFNGFKHGDEIKPNAIKGMTITATRRATEPEPGFGKPCPGPLLVLDTREDFRSVDKDLQRCKDCRIVVWSKDGNRRKVNDCGEHPGVLVTITFKKLQSLQELELWDLEEPTFVELYGTKNRLLKNISAPDGPGQDGNPAILQLLTTHVRTMKIYLGGSGGIRRFTACKGGSVWGDPHIYTLDGDKFDLYENGTYTIFQYSGQKLAQPKHKGRAEVDWKLYSHYGGPLWTVQGLLLEDRSMGRFRQALELSSTDCEWRSKTGDRGHWQVLSESGHSVSLLEDEDYVTSFEYVNEKKITLRMNGEHGRKDTIVMNTVCKPSGINLRVSMPNMADSQFLEGQINPAGGQHMKFQTNQGWAKLGGSAEVAEFLEGLESKHAFIAASCEDAERATAEKLCSKHLGGEMRAAEGINAQIFEDCISDVCRGGEEFAESAAEQRYGFKSFLQELRSASVRNTKPLLSAATALHRSFSAGPAADVGDERWECGDPGKGGKGFRPPLALAVIAAAAKLVMDEPLLKSSAALNQVLRLLLRLLFLAMALSQLLEDFFSAIGYLGHFQGFQSRGSWKMHALALMLAFSSGTQLILSLADRVWGKPMLVYWGVLGFVYVFPLFLFGTTDGVMCYAFMYDLITFPWRLVTGHMAEIWVAVPVIIAGALLAMLPLAWVRAGDDGRRAFYSRARVSVSCSDLISYLGYYSLVKFRYPDIAQSAPEGGGKEKIFKAFKASKLVLWDEVHPCGDSSAVSAQLTSGVTKIVSGLYAFAVMKVDGSAFSWGHGSFGGNYGSASSQLTSDVVDIFSSGHAFAALKSDGKLVTWGAGNQGGSLTVPADVTSQASSGVATVGSNSHVFAAIKTDGSAFTWGEAPYGGSHSEPVTSELTSGVVSIISGHVRDGRVLAAMKSDGKALVWGGQTGSHVFSGVKAVTVSTHAAAILFADGAAEAVGSSSHGGDESSVSSQLTNIGAIYSTGYAFAAVKCDIVAGGEGGDSSAVSSHLTANVDRVIGGPQKECRHMAAIKSDGTGLVWGSSESGVYSNVKDIVPNGRATGILFNDGTVQVMGDSTHGGDTGVAAGLSNVEKLYRSGLLGFAAVYADGSATTWGEYADSNGVDLSCCIKDIRSAWNTATALKEDGSVVSWQRGRWGTDPTDKFTQIFDGSVHRWDGSAFAGITDGGKVVTWGVFSNHQPADLQWFSTTTSSTTTATRTRTRMEAVPQIVANGGGFAALTAFGSVTAWGSDTTGVEASLTSEVYHIAATKSAFAALKNDGSVVTWPTSDTYGGDSSSVASQLQSGVIKLVGGLYAFGVLKDDGSALSWGDSRWGGAMTTGASNEVSVASEVSSDVVDIFAIAHGIQALKADGSLVVWGSYTQGGSLLQPSDVSASLASGVVNVGGNSHAVAALKDDGSIVTFGNSGKGGAVPSGAAPYLTSGVLSIVNGHPRDGDHIAVMKSDGSAVVWDDSSYGVYMNVKSVTVNMRAAAILKNDGTVEVLGTVYKSGWAFAAVKSDGSVFAWGDSTRGGDLGSAASSLTNGVQLDYFNGHDFHVVNPDSDNFYIFDSHDDKHAGDGTVATTGQYYFSQSDLEAGLGCCVTKVAGSDWAFAALKADGSVYSWGYSLESDTSSVDLSANIVDVVSNSAGFAAVKNDGTILTWGRAGAHEPGAVDLSNVSVIVGGEWAFAALKADGSVVTWGNGAGGDSSSVASELASGVLSIEAPKPDGFHRGFVAWKAGGTAVIWGHNTDGTHIALPSQVISDVKKVEMAGLAVGVLKNDGTVITAGRADDARSFADSSSVAAQLTNVVDLVCPAYACAALRVDGTVVTWGYADWFGSSRRLSGSSGLTNIQKIYGSFYSFAGLKTDGSVVTWGWSGSQYGTDFSSPRSSTSSEVQSDVVEIYSNPTATEGGGAFVALKQDGGIVAWGNSQTASIPYNRLTTHQYHIDIVYVNILFKHILNIHIELDYL
ncbi:ANKRD50 [Symbiodinium sp. CCMP2592]|nr:ANKRD50 [Symbiodinium sp. CCMP2592]